MPACRSAAGSLLALPVMLSIAVAQGGLPAEANRGATHVIESCTVGMLSNIELPATEAGVLTYVGIKRGSRVGAEEIMVKIDTREAELAVERAQAEYKLAVRRAEQTVQLNYAQATEMSARADYEEVLRVKADIARAITNTELRKVELEWRRATAGVEKAEEDQAQYALEADIKRAELDAAKMAVEKRQIRAPFSGEILELHREQGEWVQPGDMIAEFAQLDTLKVDGTVYFDEYSPTDLADCRVTIEVDLGRGRTVEATGWVTYIDPVAVYTNNGPRYHINAEIANRQEKGRWLISPNMQATMKVHLGTAEDTQVGGRVPQTGVAK